jgi:GH25 family lysozyme M1 (1,4-beta-N-acetylmuramidase)
VASALLLEARDCIDYVPYVKTLLRVTISHIAVVGGVAAALSLAAVPGARGAAAEPASPPVRGLDISAYQHTRAPIDWGRLADQGVRFIAVKVSEGTYYTNPYYPADARAAVAAGLGVMPYAFANPSRSGGAATASFAVRAVRAALKPGGLPLVVDLENDPYKKAADCYGVGIPAMISWITGFTARAEALTGKWPIIYTTADWWQECTGSTGQFRRDPLWLAAFGGTLPTVPSPWGHWTFWQYDNAGFLPGIGQTDLDYYQPTSGLPALRAPASAHLTQKRTPAAKPKRHPKATPKTKHHSKAHPKVTPKTKVTLKTHAKAAPKAKATAKSHPKTSLKTALKGHGHHKKQAKARNQPKPGKHKRPESGSRSYPGKFA